MKKKYVTPKGSVLIFDKNNVITLSGDDLGIMPDDWFEEGKGGTGL